MTDLFEKLNALDKVEEQQPASELSVKELMDMIEEMTASYGHLISHVDNLSKQNYALAFKVKTLEEQSDYLLSKDPEYMAHFEMLAKESQASAETTEQV